MHFVTDKDIPAWYELDFQKDEFVITINHEVFTYLKKTLCEPLPIADFMRQVLNLPKYYPPTLPKWGFWETISTRKNDDKVEMICKLPVVKSFHNLNKDYAFSHNQSICISASLELLFKALNNIKPITDADFPQILTIEMNLYADSSGIGLSAGLSRQVGKWIGKMPHDSENKDIINAMLSAYTTMRASKRSILDRFSANLRHPNRIDMMCPGDRCELNPDHQDVYNSKKGYELWPHNIDSCLQQLTLLAGLAKLYQLVKLDILSVKTPS